MADQRTFQELLGCLDDHSAYTIFLTGQRAYEGSFRIDRCLGSEVKHSHHLFESYRDAEIYPEPPEGDSAQKRAAEATISHKIEHAIKERYRLIVGEAGLKARSFEVMRVTSDGRYVHEDIEGERLSDELKRLIHASRTLTLVEKGSRADHLLHATLASTGNVRLHPEELHFSDLSPEEKELYEIEASDAEDEEDLTTLEENVAGHHPE
jgi:hypothetical protein